MISSNVLLTYVCVCENNTVWGNHAKWLKYSIHCQMNSPLSGEPLSVSYVKQHTSCVLICMSMCNLCTPPHAIHFSGKLYPHLYCVWWLWLEVCIGTGILRNLTKSCVREQLHMKLVGRRQEILINMRVYWVLVLCGACSTFIHWFILLRVTVFYIFISFRFRGIKQKIRCKLSEQQECAGLIRNSLGMNGIGRNFFRGGRDWSKFL